jgi:hypothetical protein
MRIKPITKPEVDIIGEGGFEGRNGILTVYYYETEHSIEVTVVFEDEDHPSLILGHIYDLIRRWMYGEKKDIETFWIVLEDGQSFFVWIPDHKTRTASSYNFSWNHLLSESDDNPELDKKIWIDYLVKNGTRGDAEVFFRNFYL